MSTNFNFIRLYTSFYGMRFRNSEHEVFEPVSEEDHRAYRTLPYATIFDCILLYPTTYSTLFYCTRLYSTIIPEQLTDYLLLRIQSLSICSIHRRHKFWFYYSTTKISLFFLIFFKSIPSMVGGSAILFKFYSKLLSTPFSTK